MKPLLLLIPLLLSPCLLAETSEEASKRLRDMMRESERRAAEKDAQQQRERIAEEARRQREAIIEELERQRRRKPTPFSASPSTPRGHPPGTIAPVKLKERDVCV